MSKRAVLYARVSGDDRHNEGRNLQGQLLMCREYALQRGYEVIEELAEDDRGASGAAFELPQLNKVRELAQNKSFDVLITRELDRLSRNLAKQLFVEEELRRSGVTLEYVLGEYPDTPEGNLMKNIRASVAEFERLKISERMNRGRLLKVKSGSVLVYGRAPYGYKEVERDNKYVLEIDEAEAAVVRQIFEWYTEGDGERRTLGYRGIQAKLDEMHIPSSADQRPIARKKRGWGKWAQSTIGLILKSETYAGVWTYGKRSNSSALANASEDERRVEVPPIISRETWEAAQVQMQTNVSRSPRNVKHEYLLRGHVRCGECGSPAGAAKHSNWRNREQRYGYYRCRRAQVGSDYAVRCMARSFPLEAVDEVVWNWLRSLLTEPTTLAKGLRDLREGALARQQPFQARLEVVERQLEDLQVKSRRLMDLYLDGGFGKEELETRRRDLQDSRESLEDERTRLLSQLEVVMLSEEQTKSAERYAAQIGELVKTRDDFQFRRFVVETLEVAVTLSQCDSQKIVDVECLLGQERFPIASRSTHPVAQSVTGRLPRRG